MSDVNAFLDMFKAINDMVSATNGAMAVDADASSKLGETQFSVMKTTHDILDKDLKAIQDAAKSDNPNDLTVANQQYAKDNAICNSRQQKISNMVEAATTDVNNGSSQAQQDLAMAGTINQAIGFFNGLLSQAFAA